MSMKMFIAGIFATVFLAFPIVSQAFLSLPFGGRVTSFIPCTCPPFGLVIQYQPLFLGKSFPIFGQLYYHLSTRLYMWFAPFGPVLPGTPNTWNLGKYTPGDAAECRQPDPAQLVTPDVDPCEPGIPVPTLGTIDYMGSSLPI